LSNENHQDRQLVRDGLKGDSAGWTVGAAVRIARVELKFFRGLSERETAEAMDVSIPTLKRDWNFTKAWLFDQLSTTPASP
jgi:hypothetical protein